MATKRICPRCKNPLKRVVYGMPSSEVMEDDSIILGGCLVGPNDRAWDCHCNVVPNRDIAFDVVVADITTLKVDAIVNAANSALLAGGGVSGAIHKVSGPQLEAECLKRFPFGIDAGSVAKTKAYNLPAKMVIHAVAPKFHETGPEGIYLLRSAYTLALLEADLAGAKAIAIPSLGTGIYGWKVANVAEAVIDAILETLPLLGNLERVTLCCFSDEDASLYGEAKARR